MADAYQLFRLSLIEQRQPSFFSTSGLTRSEFLQAIFGTEILFKHYGSEFHYKPADDKGTYIVGRIGRKIQAVENLPPEQGFDEQLHDGWLASVVLVQPEDRGDGQKLSMQIKRQIGTVFPILKSLVAHIINLNISEILFLEIQPIFDAATFWKFADDHKGDVTSITFDFVMPNGLWSTASTLREELKQANKTTNAQELTTTLKSQAGLITDSPAVVEAVEYAQTGSGAISAKSREGHRYSSKSKIKKISLLEDIGKVVKSHLARATANAARILDDE